jgi:hypothetical protein
MLPNLLPVDGLEHVVAASAGKMISIIVSLRLAQRHMLFVPSGNIGTLTELPLTIRANLIRSRSIVKPATGSSFEYIYVERERERERGNSLPMVANEAQQN